MILILQYLQENDEPRPPGDNTVVPHLGSPRLLGVSALEETSDVSFTVSLLARGENSQLYPADCLNGASPQRAHALPSPQFEVFKNVTETSRRLQLGDW